MKVGVSMARKRSSPQIHLHTSQQRLSEGRVKMNVVCSLLATSLLLSRTLDLSMNQPGLGLGIPNPARPRRKNCLACWTPNFWGRKQSGPYGPGSDGRALSPPARTRPTSYRTTGYISPPHPSAVSPRDKRGDKGVKRGAKAGGTRWFKHQT